LVRKTWKENGEKRQTGGNGILQRKKKKSHMEEKVASLPNAQIGNTENSWGGGKDWSQENNNEKTLKKRGNQKMREETKEAETGEEIKIGQGFHRLNKNRKKRCEPREWGDCSGLDKELQGSLGGDASKGNHGLGRERGKTSQKPWSLYITTGSGESAQCVRVWRREHGGSAKVGKGEVRGETQGGEGKKQDSSAKTNAGLRILMPGSGSTTMGGRKKRVEGVMR